MKEWVALLSTLATLILRMFFPPKDLADYNEERADIERKHKEEIRKGRPDPDFWRKRGR